MDIQEVDLGSTLVRTCLQGSGRLVVVFESGGDGRGLDRPERPAWAQALVAKAGWDGLHIMPKVLDWYQAPEVWRFFKTMRATGFFGGYKSVVTYGCSMGGFAALAFAKLARAERVVALQPRTTLRWAVPWPSTQSSALKYSRVGPHADALDGVAPDMQVQIFADPFYARDWAHAQRVEGALSRRAIAGELTRGWYNEALRARRGAILAGVSSRAATPWQGERCGYPTGRRPAWPRPRRKIARSTR